MSSNDLGDEANSDRTQLSTRVPDLSLEDAEALVHRLYGIEGAARLLTSERDQNFHLATASGDAYLLKISNPSEADEIVGFQTACLEHIARVDPGLPVQRVIHTVAGKSADHVVLRDGRRCVLRLLTFLQGRAAKDTARDGAQRIAFATTLARLDLALRDFRHAAASHDLLWNASRVDRLAHLVDEISGAERRRLAGHFMSRFIESVQPRLGGLRAQVIHNDYNLYNILVGADDVARVTGIIDFGDMVHAPLVGEVATGATFQMGGGGDPFADAAEFIGAYHTALPLLPEEQELVAELVAARHLVTVLITGWRATRYPENRVYILRHNPAAWEALFQMADVSPETARDRLLARVHSRGPQ